jgi:hypothetical protein
MFGGVGGDADSGGGKPAASSIGDSVVFCITSSIGGTRGILEFRAASDRNRVLTGIEVASATRSPHPLEHFADPEKEGCRSDAPPRSDEDADDDADSDDRDEPDDLGSMEMEASGLRHRFIMPSAGSSGAVCDRASSRDERADP